VAIVTLLAPALAKSVAPVEVKVENLPVEGVVAPIAVPLIPVAVVLKLFAVTERLFEPVLIEEVPSPARDNAPDVPVRFSAPVVKVKPLLAVRSPADVIVPVLVVEIFPVVEMVILEAKSDPVIEVKVGSPAAFP